MDCDIKYIYLRSVDKDCYLVISIDRNDKVCIVLFYVNFGLFNKLYK